MDSNQNSHLALLHAQLVDGGASSTTPSQQEQPTPSNNNNPTSSLQLIEEKVEVNQRHLVDKILARYSSDFTVFRELIQNSNDAFANTVELSFLSPPNTPTLSNSVGTIIYRNNGRPFSQQDWSRLRKIAEGNPDEQKIGFFGVGFYSLFSICDEPLLTSGNECMAFFWKGDQLYTKRGIIPAESNSSSSSSNEITSNGNPWTTFYLKLREPQPIFDRVEFAKFLVTSLGFTANLRHVRVFIDNELIFDINKKAADIRPLEFQSSAYTVKSPYDLFKISDIGVQSVQMDFSGYLPPPTVKTDKEKSFTNAISTFWNSFIRDPNEKTSQEKDASNVKKPDYVKAEATVFLRIAVGNLMVTPPAQVIRDMERTTKKPPPKKTSVQLLWTNFDELDSSSSIKDQALHGIFEGLVPYPSQGRIFIGFQTHQTTGACFHLAGQLIPTVERESIDFVDQTLLFWNSELIGVSAVIARIVYEDELKQISQLYESLSHDTESRKYLTSRSIHALKCFHYHPSTPHPLVSRILNTQFFQCSRNPLSILSSRHGVLPLNSIRLRTKDVDEILDSPTETDESKRFLTKTPLLPVGFYDQTTELMDFFSRQKWIRPFDISDILNEVSGNRVLSLYQLKTLLKWWTRNRVSCLDDAGRRLLDVVAFVDDDEVGDGKTGNVKTDTTAVANTSTSTVTSFFTAALNVASGNDRGIKRRYLRDIKYWPNVRVLFEDSLIKSLPDTVLPVSVGKYFRLDELVACFRWIELPLSVWLEGMILRHPCFAETTGEKAPTTEDIETLTKVLTILSKHVPTHSRQSEETAIILSLLSERKCIPTRHGLQKPSQSYFKTVNLFSDLPVIQFPNAKYTPTTEFLKLLGVRDHVDLKILFERIDDLDWDYVHLIRYLVHIDKENRLSDYEFGKLRATPLFVKEENVDDGGREVTEGKKKGKMGLALLKRLSSPTSTTPPSLVKSESVQSSSQSSTQSQPQESTEQSIESLENELESKMKLGGKSTGRIKYKASDLYAPDDALRAFNIPILAWKKGKWRPGSDEALFLEKLGLKTFIPLAELINAIATERDHEKRFKLLQYFMDKFKDTYQKYYYPDRVRVKFLPGVGDSSSEEKENNIVLCTPDQVFAETGCTVMGFLALHPRLSAYATQFGVARNPPSALLVDALISSPPGTIDKAKLVFGYLTSRMQDFTDRDWKRLRDCKFIPIVAEDKVKHVGVNQVYLGDGKGPFASHFTYVSFGAASGDAFLKACGVKDEPTPVELAYQVANNPTAFVGGDDSDSQQSGIEKYLDLLRQLAGQWWMLKNDKKLVDLLARKEWLVGVVDSHNLEYDAADDEDDDEDDEDDDAQTLASASTTRRKSKLSGPVRYKLARADQICLVDDTVLLKLFTPLSCPIDTLLEDFYQSLGSAWLSTLVTEQFEPIGTSRSTTGSSRLEALIRERTPLLLYDIYANPQYQKKQAKEAEKLFSSLKVYSVPQIRIHRTYQPNRTTKTSDMTACLLKDKSNVYVLFISEKRDSSASAEPDYFDVGQVLGRVLFGKNRFQEGLLIATLLSTKLELLRNRGWPVDRIIKKQQREDGKNKKKGVLMPSATKPTDTATQSSSRQSTSTLSLDKSNSQLQSDELTLLKSLFPNIDPAMLIQRLNANKGDVEATCNEFLNQSGSSLNLNESSSSQQVASSSEQQPPPYTDDTVIPGGFDSRQLTKSPQTPKQPQDDYWINNVISKGGDWFNSLMGAPTSSNSSNSSNSSTSNTTTSMVRRQPQPTTTRPIESQNMRKVLDSAIQSCRRSSTTGFNAAIPNDPPLPVPQDLATFENDYCSLRNTYDFVFVGQVNGVNVFVDKKELEAGADVSRHVERLYQEFQEAITLFVPIVVTLGAQVFGVSRAALNVYVDTSGSTIAFNRSRSLFFNARFFKSLHLQPGTNQVKMRKALAYWFMTFAHELAHNFIDVHDAQHGFFTGEFAQEYMEGLVSVMNRYSD